MINLGTKEDKREVKVVLSLGPCNHVVDVYLNLMMDRVMEQGDHGALICCLNILQSEGHDFVAKGTPLRNKGCLLHVFGIHFNLIVTGETFHKVEDFMLSGVVN